MKLRALPIFISLLIGVSAAWSKAESSLRPSPAQAGFIGIWWPDEKAQQEIRKRSSSAAAMFELELRSDGKFAFVNIPKWWRNVFGQPSGKISGIGGDWTLREGAAGTEVFLESFGLAMTLGVGGEEESREIIIHVGDGDRSIAVRLLRKSGELNPPEQPQRNSGGRQSSVDSPTPETRSSLGSRG
jgi:hypothetical protein